MKFFQKRGVAIAVLILAIIASGAWGLHKAPAVSTPEGGEKLDPSLSTAAFTQYVRDEADILSDKTEEAVGLYNANWNKMFGSIMAVVTTESANDLENTAYGNTPSRCSLASMTPFLSSPNSSRTIICSPSGIL